MWEWSFPCEGDQETVSCPEADKARVILPRGGPSFSTIPAVCFTVASLPGGYRLTTRKLYASTSSASPAAVVLVSLTT